MLKNPRAYGRPQKGREFGKLYQIDHGSEDSSLYDYGWPSGGTSESDVAAQFLFDEASGSIEDEVSGITCTVEGTPSFSEAAAGYGFTPGVEYTTNDGHNKTSAEATMVIGTGDATIEYWFKAKAAGVGVAYVFENYVAGTGGVYVYYKTNVSANQFMIKIVADDATTVTMNNLFKTDINDDAWHKHRIVIDRSGNLDFLLDGVSQKTASLATLVGKTIPCPKVIFGNSSAMTTNDANGALAEWRLSLNATNNSGGPGGG